MSWFDRFRRNKTADDGDNDMAKIAGAIEKTRVPYVRIEVADADIALPPTVSKLGGVPYVPVGSELPTTEPYVPVGGGTTIDRLAFVAQINFTDVALEPYPRSGLVQLWIAVDDILGMRYPDGVDIVVRANGTRRGGFRVVYHADVDRPARSDLPPPIDAGPVHPSVLTNGRALQFHGDTELLGTEDHRWKPFLAQLGIAKTPKGAYTTYTNAGHRLGGYCAFTQTDPRDPADPPLSLLQLDSDANVFWGDTGLAHWFIREHDLRAKDFSKVEYYWDCC